MLLTAKILIGFRGRRFRGAEQIFTFPLAQYEKQLMSFSDFTVLRLESYPSASSEFLWREITTISVRRIRSEIKDIPNSYFGNKCQTIFRNIYPWSIKLLFEMVFELQRHLYAKY